MVNWTTMQKYSESQLCLPNKKKKHSTSLFSLLNDSLPPPPSPSNFLGSSQCSAAVFLFILGNKTCGYSLKNTFRMSLCSNECCSKEAGETRSRKSCKPLWFQRTNILRFPRSVVETKVKLTTDSSLTSHLGHPNCLSNKITEGYHLKKMPNWFGHRQVCSKTALNKSNYFPQPTILNKNRTKSIIQVKKHQTWS